jgi:acyl carrier protein
MMDIRSELINGQVKEILLPYFTETKGPIGGGSRLVEDLCVDSVDVVEVIMALNEAFDIDLPDAEASEWRTVADICCSVRVCKEV